MDMFTRPQKDQILSYVGVVFLVFPLFVLVYGFTNHWASQSSHPYQLWLSFEPSLPLVPEFIFIYFSLNILMSLPIFVLSARSIRALGLSMAVAILIAGAIFFLVPAPIGYQRLSELPRYNTIFQTLYYLDNVANTFPSLHIALSHLTVRSLCQKNSSLFFLWIWFGLICLSVIFTHQHHLIDIVGGFILSEICFRIVYLRFRDK